MAAEVDKQRKSEPGSFQVIVNLGTMLVADGAYRFQFDDKLSVADEVWNILLAKRPPFVSQFERQLGSPRNALASQLNSLTFLANRFQEAAAFFVVDLQTCPDDAVALVFVDQVHLAPRLLDSCDSYDSWSFPLAVGGL